MLRIMCLIMESGYCPLVLVLSGSIPGELGQLRYLLKLNLWANQLMGEDTSTIELGDIEKIPQM